MLVSEKIEEKIFYGSNIKDAYLKACKWISTNIIAVNNSNNMTYKIEKSKDNYEVSVKVTIYVTIDEGEMFERHCAICKETTGAFFMKQNKFMCETCKLLPYRKRIKEKLDLIKEVWKGKR